MEQKIRCSAMVSDSGGWHHYQCAKPAKVERDGKWYCKIHDPEYIASKQQKHEEKYELEFKERIKVIRLNAAAPDMYEALQEAKLQIEYLHEKFTVTGTGNTILSRIQQALDKADGKE